MRLVCHEWYVWHHLQAVEINRMHVATHPRGEGFCRHSFAIPTKGKRMNQSFAAGKAHFPNDGLRQQLSGSFGLLYFP